MQKLALKGMLYDEDYYDALFEDLPKEALMDPVDVELKWGHLREKPQA